MSDERRYLVIGAQGFQGAAVARALLAGGHEVRGFAKAGGTPAPGAPEVPTVTGDLADPAVVRAAFEGITHASVVLPLVYDAEQVVTFARNVAEAAKAAGVTRLVYNTNTPVPAETTPYAAYETRRAAEAVFTGAGLPLVVLRPPVYLDNLFSPWNGPALINDGVLAYPLAEDRRVAWLSHADLAAATVAALHRPGIEGTVLALGGPEAVTGSELATAFGAALGREVSYLPLEVGAFEAGLREVVGADAAAGVSGIYKWAAQSSDPELFTVDHDEVTRVLGITPTPITEWVAAQHWEVWAGQPA
ncbi:NmrA family NAD(P)-binding protein [Actinokineospora sp. NBRC 105648]|uniref:SDR family oxidoreductase n=1 Tax=Actinokineospora sp. NBRC 105648 TaxID=3032206 RepID=UPI0024A48246|nr:NmrA family NAD(P)-binding protein [Actinokineospora sp. NBRC 105648]GLZ42516.1 nucleotide-diphosphate-sugar epimerase [Actinokineospora sp. NBRC 105648]